MFSNWKNWIVGGLVEILWWVSFFWILSNNNIKFFSGTTLLLFCMVWVYVTLTAIVCMVIGRRMNV
jgi:hypothetical protein